MSAGAFSFSFGEDNDIQQDENDFVTDDCKSAVPTQIHSHDQMISYGTITIPFPNDAGGIRIRRRELFDIRAQMMSEDTSSGDCEPIGLSIHDIKPNVYEGGFKTWECSTDLAAFLVSSMDHLSTLVSGQCIIVEVGAGSAIPSLLTYNLLLAKQSNGQTAHFVLADFNVGVLQMCTVPNILLNWASCRGHLKCDQGELEVTEELLSAFRKDHANIIFDFVSGPWGSSFQQCLQHCLETSGPKLPECRMLVLASETIYSLSSTLSLVEVLQCLFNLVKGHVDCTALIAAKKIYFGVGGGVDNFMRLLEERGRRTITVWEEPQGVGRVILNVQ